MRKLNTLGNEDQLILRLEHKKRYPQNGDDFKEICEKLKSC